MRLHAELASDWYSMMWEAHACAQLVVYGPELGAARLWLRRAAADRALLAA